VSGSVSVQVAGEALELLPERVAFWSAAATLLIADPHFGKAATFRAAGFAVPRGTTAGALARLDAALERTGAGKLVVLGDFFHARAGRVRATLDALERWRARRADLEITLVRGNHDREAGDPLEALRIRCVDAPLAAPPFAFVHHPADVAGAYAIAGHLHPAAVLRGPGRQRHRLPCFWLRERIAVLPAFGEFTGAAEIRASTRDGVFVIADDEVMRVG
jgi:uncharacterized protein